MIKKLRCHQLIAQPWLVSVMMPFDMCILTYKRLFAVNNIESWLSEKFFRFRYAIYIRWGASSAFPPYSN